ncbi:PleD family two-component system response regulator [Candidatus Neomarinimicrobiota bacterium]
MAKNYKILVVDDDENTRITLCDLFAEVGYEVIMVPSGEEALDKAREERPAVALVDTRLPGIDGFEVCRRIKEIEELDIKVIIYTAYIDAVNVVKAREVGADDFMGKISDFSNLHRGVGMLVKEK